MVQNAFELQSAVCNRSEPNWTEILLQNWTQFSVSQKTACAELGAWVRVANSIRTSKRTVRHRLRSGRVWLPLNHGSNLRSFNFQSLWKSDSQNLSQTSQSKFRIKSVWYLLATFSKRFVFAFIRAHTSNEPLLSSTSRWSAWSALKANLESEREP